MLLLIAVALFLVRVGSQDGVTVADIVNNETYYNDSLPILPISPEASPLQINNSNNLPSNNNYDVEKTCKSKFYSGLERGLYENGTQLSLLLALPLSSHQGQPLLNPGFFHLASAVLAMDHFNERNSVIVPELTLPEYRRDCGIQIDLKDRLLVLDTGGGAGGEFHNNSMAAILEHIEDFIPNGIAGPYNEIPAFHLSVVASNLGIPMVTHRGLNHDLLIPQKHPFVSQVNADWHAEMEFLGDYLLHIGRVDFIAVLYSSNTGESTQKLEAFRDVAHTLQIPNVQAFGYLSPKVAPPSLLKQNNGNNSNSSSPFRIRTISEAVQQVAESGYRTVVLLTPYIDDELFELGKAAHEQGIDQGHHLWVIPGNIELGNHRSNPVIDVMVNNNLTTQEQLAFISRAAYLSQYQAWNSDRDLESPFLTAWKQINSSFVELLQQISPIPFDQYQEEWLEYKNYGKAWNLTPAVERPETRDETFPPSNFFSDLSFFSRPAQGSIYIYDAIMSIVIGACKAINEMKHNATANPDARQAANNEKYVLSGVAHRAGIRSARFHGASGEVRFGGTGFSGSRDGETVTFCVLNLYPEGLSGILYRETECRNATDKEWYQSNPFVYADGSINTPPEPLRAPGDQNYLSKGAQVAGLTLMGVVFLAVASSSTWLLVYRHHTVVKASQPQFLYFLCMASAITAVTIYPASMDESQGFNEEQLTMACISIPWCLSLGLIMTYNALFTKLWRVNRVLQFSRRTVKVIHVIWPAIVIEVITIVLLSVWTAITDYGWERVYVNGGPDSIGKCSGEGSLNYGFLVPILVLVLIPIILTELMAWKTSDVDATYSESKWIFALILFHFQVILVGVPLVVILFDVDVDGRFIGFSLIVFTFPMTTLGLIMGPKMFAVHKPETDQRESRGATGGVRVSGFATTTTATTADPKPPTTTTPTTSVKDQHSHAETSK